MGRRSDLLGGERGFLGDAQAARSADPSPLQPTRFGVPDVRASARTRGRSCGSLPRSLSNADARRTVTTGGRSRRHRCSAGNRFRRSCTWRRSHRNRGRTAAARGHRANPVRFVRAALLVGRAQRAGRLRLRTARAGRRLHRFRCLFFASASPESAASPTSARVDAAAAPRADLGCCAACWAHRPAAVSASNRDPSMAASHLGDAAAPPLLTKRRPVRPELLARREQARRCHIGRAQVPSAGSSVSSTATSSVTPHVRDWMQPPRFRTY